jgi:hypothetical protein
MNFRNIRLTIFMVGALFVAGCGGSAAEEQCSSAVVALVSTNKVVKCSYQNGSFGFTCSSITRSVVPGNCTLTCKVTSDTSYTLLGVAASTTMGSTFTANTRKQNGDPGPLVYCVVDK